jgi:hypothetical protein
MKYVIIGSGQIQGSSVSAEPTLDLPYTTSRAMEFLYGSYEPGSLS